MKGQGCIKMGNLGIDHREQKFKSLKNWTRIIRRFYERKEKKGAKA